MKANIITICLSLFFLCVLAERKKMQAGEGMEVDIDTQTGAYTIAVDGSSWFSSSTTGFHSDQHWYTTQNGMLKLNKVDQTKGEDGVYGSFSMISFEWSNSSSSDSSPFFITDIIAYEDTETIVFRQHYPEGIQNTQVGQNDDVVSSFPSFDVVSPLFFFTYEGIFAVPKVGTWGDGTYKADSSTGCPLVFYTPSLRSVLISPRSNFMVSQFALSPSLNKTFTSGINGEVMQIPQGYIHETIIHGSSSITSVFLEWGSGMMASYGKTPTSFSADPFIQYLGYWTDNGAYYYYKTEDNTTYEETMIMVQDSMASLGVPVRNYQLDSWWYFKGKNDGVTLWQPMPSIFPDGLVNYQNKINKPLILHNRYFAVDNDYLKNYTFIVEDEYCLPLDYQLFYDIMSLAVTWGMRTYEQDWLITVYQGMKATQNNVTNARTWLMAMGDAASDLGLTLQYCMPLPNHILQSVEIPAVSQVRATTDYQPGNDQWKIAHSSLLIWSLGAIPFKDDFWTTSTQDGCMFKSCFEPNPLLEVLVASLSAGPVGPSDRIGHMNKEYVMQTTTADGLLLKADTPAFPVDKTYLPSSTSSPTIMQVWHSCSSFGNTSWQYILAAELEEEFTITPSDLISSSGPAFGEFVIFDYFEMQNGTAIPAKFSDDNPLFISEMKKNNKEKEEEASVPYKYYIAAPIITTSSGSSFAVLGEVNKFIPMSKQRFVEMNPQSEPLTAVVQGTVGEQITIAIFSPSSSSISYVSSVFASDTLFLTCSDEGVCVLQPENSV